MARCAERADHGNAVGCIDTGCGEQDTSFDRSKAAGPEQTRAEEITFGAQKSAARFEH
jgi:hypothetical protein